MRGGVGGFRGIGGTTAQDGGSPVPLRCVGEMSLAGSGQKGLPCPDAGGRLFVSICPEAGGGVLAQRGQWGDFFAAANAFSRAAKALISDAITEGAGRTRLRAGFSLPPQTPPPSPARFLLCLPLTLMLLLALPSADGACIPGRGNE